MSTGPTVNKDPAQIMARAAQIFALASAEVRNVVSRIVDLSADQLVDVFYSTLTQDEEAMRFLSHQLVSERLQSSLRKWVVDLFALRNEQEFEGIIEHQRTIGDIHARLRVPIRLVMQGADLLKIGICNRLREADDLRRDDLWMAVVYTNNLLDFALEIINQSFLRSATARAQVDEAYRLFSLGQDVSVDRESQRAALLEWSQRVLFSLYGAERITRLPTIASSEFGLWLNHRAGVMFQGSPTLQLIERATRQIDRNLLPRIAAAKNDEPSQLPELTEEFRTAVFEVKFLLSDMFQSVAAIEHGRDPLTKTLNRRFLPSILSREISLAVKDNTKFSIIMLDVDHFKRINDEWGHPVGDAVLAQVAEAILDTCRLSDFVFRYGGEEFLIALVETDTDAAYQAAERIRLQVEMRQFRSPDNKPLSATVSLGVATFDGHPDFTYLIHAADRALYTAKRNGRNRTVVAGSAQMLQSA